MSSGDGINVLSDLTKRWGATRGSITCLGNRLLELEDCPGDSDNVANADLYATKLDSLSSEFREVHYQILSFFDEEADLEKQQDVLDSHDEVVSSMILRPWIINTYMDRKRPLNNCHNPRCARGRRARKLNRRTAVT